MSGNDNPGNFANRPKEEVQAAAQKGGEASKGGFATMDPDKQVCYHLSIHQSLTGVADTWICRRKLLPWVARHPVDPSSQAARRLRRQVLKVDLLGDPLRLSSSGEQAI